MDNNKFLLVKGKAGLGNRILAVLESILYAKITHRQLVVDWSDYAYSNDNENVFHKFFIAQGIRDTSIIPSESSIYPQVWRKNLNKSVNEVIDLYDGGEKDRHRNPKIWQKYTIDIADTNYNEDILVRWAYFHQLSKLRRHFKNDFKYLAPLNDADILKKTFYYNLEIHPNIIQRVDEFKKKHFHRQQIIGVHVRYTDLKNPYDKYYRIINEFLQKNPDIIIFIATDNQHIEKEFKTKYTNVIATNKWYPKDESSLHQNRNCPDRFENGVQALVDICLLSECDYLIYDTTSTFAFIAKLLSNIPEENIIDISKYSLKQQIKNFLKWMRQRQLI